MLNWVKQFNIFCLLDSQEYNDEKSAFECLLAVGCKRSLTAASGNALSQLQAFYKENPSWLFGHLGYDLKNETAHLSSSNPDKIEFPDLFFFEPEILIQLTANTVIFHGVDAPEQLYHTILSMPDTIEPNAPYALNIQSRFSKDAYIKTIHQLQAHILRGDCYEINFCQEFFAANAKVNPIVLYHRLTTISPNPFAALYRLNDCYCVCASPERYIQIKGNQIISQPIKGTAKRNLKNIEIDELHKSTLLHSEKERSENVMVVDLVRNDLSRCCEEGSVHVEELFGIYSFPQVHQMISTVKGTLAANKNWVDAIQVSFPMGSMTGAPKKRVLELIEQYEQTKRGIFSGSIGYCTPYGDVDFNVIIRSILYNATKQYLSFQTGSAITYYADAEMEYEECLMKAAAIRSVLT
ncbi:MAG: anthranilate synthase component I family protein [Ferruginibacter sp.]